MLSVEVPVVLYQAITGQKSSWEPAVSENTVCPCTTCTGRRIKGQIQYYSVIIFLCKKTNIYYMIQIFTL